MVNIGENKDDFKEMLEEYMPEIESGQVKKGVIISKDSEYGYLHIGGKSEGRLKVSEIEEYQVGEEIDVLVLNKEDKEGYTRISRLAVEQSQNWEKIKEAFEKEMVLDGKVDKRVNGGYIVEVLKYMSFMPNSLSGLKNDEEVSGKKIKVVIKDVKDGKKKKILVSGKEVKMKTEKTFITSVKSGDVVEVEIKDILDFGLSVNVGPIVGFIHISEVAWKKVDDLNQLFKKGQKVKAKVITLDEEKRSLKLSLKQLKEDPWTVIDNKYNLGEVVSAEVVRIVKFGAFVEIEEGLEGLIHISDLSWSKSVKSIEDYLKIGDKIKVKITELSKNDRKLKLSIKDLTENPWNNIEEKYPVGKVVQGKVVEIKDFGIFANVEEGIDIFVHISDLAWRKEDEKDYKINDEIKLQILEIDAENQKIKGGVKQLEKSPWQKIVEKYKVEDEITRKINNITAFGIFIEVENGIDGMIHISEASKDYVKKLEDRFEIGNEIKAEIIEINNEEQKIKLSIKKIEEKEEAKQVEEFKKAEEKKEKEDEEKINAAKKNIKTETAKNDAKEEKIVEKTIEKKKK